MWINHVTNRQVIWYIATHNYWTMYLVATPEHHNVWWFMVLTRSYTTWFFMGSNGAGMDISWLLSEVSFPGSMKSIPWSVDHRVMSPKNRRQLRVASWGQVAFSANRLPQNPVVQHTFPVIYLIKPQFRSKKPKKPWFRFGVEKTLGEKDLITHNIWKKSCLGVHVWICFHISGSWIVIFPNTVTA